MNCLDFKSLIKNYHNFERIKFFRKKKLINLKNSKYLLILHHECFLFLKNYLKFRLKKFDFIYKFT